MIHAPWDTRTTNPVAACDNESDALALVLSGIAHDGPHDTDTLVLEVEDDEGNVTSIAYGHAPHLSLLANQGRDVALLIRERVALLQDDPNQVVITGGMVQIEHGPILRPR